jgi:hypothetical protein
MRVDGRAVVSHNNRTRFRFSGTLGSRKWTLNIQKLSAGIPIKPRTSHPTAANGSCDVLEINSLRSFNESIKLKIRIDRFLALLWIIKIIFHIVAPRQATASLPATLKPFCCVRRALARQPTRAPGFQLFRYSIRLVRLDAQAAAKNQQDAVCVRSR